MSPRRSAAMTLILLPRRFYCIVSPIWLRRDADFAAVPHRTYCDTTNLLLQHRLYRSFVPIALRRSLAYCSSADFIMVSRQSRFDGTDFTVALC